MLRMKSRRHNEQARKVVKYADSVVIISTYDVTMNQLNLQKFTVFSTKNAVQITYILTVRIVN